MTWKNPPFIPSLKKGARALPTLLFQLCKTPHPSPLLSWICSTLTECRLSSKCSTGTFCSLSGFALLHPSANPPQGEREQSRFGFQPNNEYFSITMRKKSTLNYCNASHCKTEWMTWKFSVILNWLQNPLRRSRNVILCPYLVFQDLRKFSPFCSAIVLTHTLRH